MKDPSKNQKVLNNSVWEFFFQLIFISQIPDIAYCLLSVIEKLLIVTPCMLIIFYDTSWDSIHSFFDIFNVLYAANYFA